MKLAKAIEILDNLEDPFRLFSVTERTTAAKLGIDALKRVSDMRISPCTTADELLPGETEE